MEISAEWLGLMIGNSHLHWAYFEQDILIRTWQTNHLDCSLNPPLIRDLSGNRFSCEYSSRFSLCCPKANRTFSRLSRS